MFPNILNWIADFLGLDNETIQQRNERRIALTKSLKPGELLLYDPSGKTPDIVYARPTTEPKRKRHPNGVNVRLAVTLPAMMVEEIQQAAEDSDRGASPLGGGNGNHNAPNLTGLPCSGRLGGLIGVSVPTGAVLVV